MSSSLPHVSPAAESPSPAKLRSWTQLAAWREIGLVALVIGVSSLLRLITYHPIADGTWSRYVKLVLVGAVSTAVVWVLVRVQTTRTLVPLVAALSVLLAGDAVHYVRRVHPVTRGGPIREFAAALTSEATARSQWDFTTSGAGQVAFDGTGVRLSSPAGSTAFMEAKLPPALQWGSAWWLPVGLGERERTEVIAWRATIRRERTYFVVLDVPPLLIQAVPYGVHVTYPDAAGVLRGHEVSHPIGQDGLAHEWRISRDSSTVRLSLDGREVWTAPQRGEIKQLRLGETRSDPEHAGEMVLQHASFSNRLEGAGR